ncbi:hypothetical protein TNCV_4899281 [Trichonephila clavipes]|nr:hypothetical protein TNCV_4899281 [Trichonephila clavipes]
MKEEASQPFSLVFSMNSYFHPIGMGSSLRTSRIPLKVPARTCGIQLLGFLRPSVDGALSDEKTPRYLGNDGNCAMLSEKES